MPAFPSGHFLFLQKWAETRMSSPETTQAFENKTLGRGVSTCRHSLKWLEVNFVLTINTG
jgi:hypothetical protein